MWIMLSDAFLSIVQKESVVVTKFQVVRTVNNFLLSEFPCVVLGEEIARNAAFALANELGDCSVVTVRGTNDVKIATEYGETNEDCGLLTGNAIPEEDYEEDE